MFIKFPSSGYLSVMFLSNITWNEGHDIETLSIYMAPFQERHLSKSNSISFDETGHFTTVNKRAVPSEPINTGSKTCILVK